MFLKDNNATHYNAHHQNYMDRPPISVTQHAVDNYRQRGLLIILLCCRFSINYLQTCYSSRSEIHCSSDVFSQFIGWLEQWDTSENTMWVLEGIIHCRIDNIIWLPFWWITMVLYTTHFLHRILHSPTHLHWDSETYVMFSLMSQLPELVEQAPMLGLPSPQTQERDWCSWEKDWRN